MEISQMKYFTKIVEAGSMAAAAEQIPMSPPSLSRSVKTLEQELGVPLFDRNGRTIAVNKAGIAFYQRIKSALEQIDLGIMEVHNFLSENSNKIRILVYSGHILIHNFLKDYTYKKPNVQVEFLNPHEDITEKDYDLILSFMPLSTGDCTPIFRRELAIIVSEESPLAQNPYVKIKELNCEPYLQLCLTDTSPQTAIIPEDILFDALRFRPQIIHTFTTVTELRSFLQYGIGYTIWPKISENDILVPGLTALPIGKNGFYNVLYLTKRTNSGISEASLEFFRYASQQFYASENRLASDT